MKKSRITAVVLLVCMLAVMLSSCGGSLKGTYVIKNDTLSTQVTKLTFKGKYVTITDLWVDTKCEYEIKNGVFTATGEAMVLGTNMSVDYEFDFEKKGNSIFLDGKEYVKK